MGDRTIAARSAASAWPVALAVALAHGINDSYSAFLHPLLPRLMAELGLTITLAATLTTTLSLAASLLQPAMGAAADRYGPRLFLVSGPLLSAVFLSLIGFAPNFGSLLCLLALGGLGSALFHPPAASVAAGVAHGGGSGARMSVFSFGGALGFAAGPLVAVALVGRLGLRGLALAMLPALVIMPLLLRFLPARQTAPSAPAGVSFAGALRSLRGPLGLLFLISTIAAFVQRVFLTLQPIAIASAGGSEALGASTLSTYLVAQAAGSLVGGLLADRFERGRVLFWITALAVPTHLLAVALPAGTAPALSATAVAGLLNMALLPPLVVMAQEASPHGAATSAGIIMGLAWAAGSILMIGAGALGDVVGARAAALVCIPLMLVGTACALHPALRRYARPPRAGA
jgi:FSR family fosmidomycin resistance protein-like MFS transporter